MYVYYDHYCAAMASANAMSVVYMSVCVGDGWDSPDGLKMSKLCQTKLLEVICAHFMDQ